MLHTVSTVYSVATMFEAFCFTVTQGGTEYGGFLNGDLLERFLDIPEGKQKAGLWVGLLIKLLSTVCSSNCPDVSRRRTAQLTFQMVLGFPLTQVLALEVADAGLTTSENPVLELIQDVEGLSQMY